MPRDLYPLSFPRFPISLSRRVIVYTLCSVTRIYRHPYPLVSLSSPFSFLSRALEFAEPEHHRRPAQKRAGIKPQAFHGDQVTEIEYIAEAELGIRRERGREKWRNLIERFDARRGAAWLGASLHPPKLRREVRNAARPVTDVYTTALSRADISL